MTISLPFSTNRSSTFCDIKFGLALILESHREVFQVNENREAAFTIGLGHGWLGGAHRIVYFGRSFRERATMVISRGSLVPPHEV